MQLINTSLGSRSGRVLALGIASLLSACGGGGDDVDASSAMMQAERFKGSPTARYGVRDLGMLCPVDTPCGQITNTVNNKGEVAGTVFSNYQHAFVFRSNALRDIGGLPPDGYAEATGINDNGQAIGWSTLVNDNAIPSYAFLYNGGAMQNLGALGQFSGGNGINNRGQVTGVAQLANGESHAFMYTGGSMSDIGTLGGTASHGMAINDDGFIVGSSTLPGNGATHAFLYRHGHMQDLGTLGGASSVAKGINNKEVVVGYSYLKTNATLRRAFLWSGHKMHDLGTLGGGESVAYGIDDSGNVVGVSNGRPFLYRDGVMRDLNDLLDSSGAGWVIDQANAISSEGMITGQGRLNGRSRVFVLVPLTNRGRH